MNSVALVANSFSTDHEIEVGSCRRWASLLAILCKVVTESPIRSICRIDALMDRVHFLLPPLQRTEISLTTKEANTPAEYAFSMYRQAEGATGMVQRPDSSPRYNGGSMQDQMKIY